MNENKIIPLKSDTIRHQIFAHFDPLNGNPTFIVFIMQNNVQRENVQIKNNKKETFFVLSFHDCPSHVTFEVDKNMHWISLLTDGLVKHAYLTNPTFDNKNIMRKVQKEKKENQEITILNKQFLHVPDGFRYGTYYVNQNKIMYVKDFWNYMSIASIPSYQQYNIQKPVLKCISTRERVNTEITFDIAPII